MSTPTIDTIVDLAYNELGTTEGRNQKVKYNDEYYVDEEYGNEAHWCAVFIWWLFKKANMLDAIDNINKGSKEKPAAAVKSFRNVFKNSQKRLEDVQAGDLMILEYSGGGGHIGLVVSDYDPKEGCVYTIEGNTSPEGAIGASDRNGDGVYLKRRSTMPPKGFIGGFYARPFWDRVKPKIPAIGQPMDEFPLSPGWVFAKGGYQSYNGKGDAYSSYVTMIQQALVIAGYKIEVDGAFGNATHNAVVAFQKSHSLSADGKVGKMTWNALAKVRDGKAPSSSSSLGFNLPKNHCYGKSGWGNHNGYDGNADDKAHIKQIQSFLGLEADGLFGNATHNAVVAFQKSHGLSADGKVGPSTWRAMFG